MSQKGQRDQLMRGSESTGTVYSNCGEANDGDSVQENNEDSHAEDENEDDQVCFKKRSTYVRLLMDSYVAAGDFPLC